tara:strand:+ start:383 stop:589 length:207 start_codon:yes stop_codon:yes gene_type:complete
MIESDLKAMSRGTLTGAMDLEQVKRARERMQVVADEMPACTQEPPIPIRIFVLAGLLIGALIWATELM